MLNFLSKGLFGESYSLNIRVKILFYLDDSFMNEDEVPQEFLPETFSAGDTVFIEEKAWEVVKADPSKAFDWSFDKKLTLWVKDPLDVGKKTHHPAGSRIRFGEQPPK